MSRRPFFWILLAVLGGGGAFVAARLFPVAFPLLSVDVRMARNEALAEARELAARHGWGLENPRAAATFGSLSPSFQTYMELEGGGLEELNRLIREGRIHLHAWRVRLFREGDVREAEVRFAPSGEPIGFRLRLPEDEPGAALSPDSAQRLAERAAEEEWGLQPRSLAFLERSETERPGGRVDHTFVYERTDLRPGEASVRLRLAMAGEELVEITPLLHVPEAFERRFQDARTGNDLIALLGQAAFLVLFLILAGGVGTLHLLRRKRLEWRTPLAVGGVVGVLMAMSLLNSLPLSWMAYDTAISPHLFRLMQVGTALLAGLGAALFVAFVLMAGEGLFRSGFPDQIHLWSFTRRGVMNSSSALGRVAAPYLVAGLELGYVVLFYTEMTRVAGWWSPAEALVEPDLLATPFPWLTAVGTSTFAALSEEALFRAIPLGAAALLGRRYGKLPLWLTGAVILQALLFAASHANYPQQPAYARVVEILPVYLLWGWACLRFGLVPTILGHFLYDLSLLSLPLFAATSGTLWLDRTVVVAVALLPVALAVAARVRWGPVAAAPEWALNRAWPQPAIPSRGARGGPAWGEVTNAEREIHEAEPAGAVPSGAAGHAVPAPSHGLQGEAGGGTPMGRSRGPLPGPLRSPAVFLLAAGAGVALGWPTLAGRDVPRLENSREEAESLARYVLSERGLELDTAWTAISTVEAGTGTAGQFAWREGGEDAYRELLGTFLELPGWQVRFLRFGGLPEERAEQFTLRFDPGGRLVRYSHSLPEARPGKALSEEEARAVSEEALTALLGWDRTRLREVEARAEARPERTDWTFTWALRPEAGAFPLPEGEGRIEIRVAGEEVAGWRTYLFVPESWRREWRNAQLPSLILELTAAGLLLLLALAGGVYAIVRWARQGLSVRTFATLAGGSGVVLLLTSLNQWPQAVGLFNSTQALSVQRGTAVLGLALGALFLAAGIGLLGALAHAWIGAGSLPRRFTSVLWKGAAAGIAVWGGRQLLGRALSGGPPAWPAYDGAVSYLAWASAALEPLAGYLGVTAAGLLYLAALDRLRARRGTPLTLPLLLLAGLALTSPAPFTPWFGWAGGVLAVAVVALLFARFAATVSWGIVPAATAAIALLDLAAVALRNPYPGSVPGTLGGTVLVALAAVLWSRSLAGACGPGAAGAGPVAEEAPPPYTADAEGT